MAKNGLAKFKAVRIVSANFIAMKFLVNFEDGKSEEVEAFFPLFGKGLYVGVLKMVNNHLSESDGWITENSFRVDPFPVQVTYNQNNQPQIHTR